MKCPVCQSEIDAATVRAEDNEQELEVGFTCRTCATELYAILATRDFVPVD